MARAIGEGIISERDAGEFFREKIDDPIVLLEMDLARISIERCRLAILELQCKDLLARLRYGAPLDLSTESSNAIKDMAELERALRGEAN